MTTHQQFSWKHAWISWFRALRRSALYFFHMTEAYQEVTEGYPDPISSRTADDLPPRSRGFLKNDVEQCTACGDCVAICPTGSILLESERTDHEKLWVSVFDIDHSKCSLCGLCVEHCLVGSLVHTRSFEGASYHMTDLISEQGRGHLTSAYRQKWGRRQMDSSGSRGG